MWKQGRGERKEEARREEWGGIYGKRNHTKSARGSGQGSGQSDRGWGRVERRIEGKVLLLLETVSSLPQS